MLENVTVAHLVRKIWVLQGTHISLPYLERVATAHYSDPKNPAHDYISYFLN